MSSEQHFDPNPTVDLEEIEETINKLVNQLRTLTDGKTEGPENKMMQHALSIRTTFRKLQADYEDPDNGTRPNIEYIRHNSEAYTGKLPDGKIALIWNNRSTIRIDEHIYVSVPNKDGKRYIKIRNRFGRIYNPPHIVLG